VIIVVVISALFSFLALNQPPNNAPEAGLLAESSNCTIQTNVAYLNDANPYHQMDVYMPSGSGPFPAIIYIHGGGWVQGN
jgi:acetyl esterase/lipase